MESTGFIQMNKQNSEIGGCLIRGKEKMNIDVNLNIHYTAPDYVWNMISESRKMALNLSMIGRIGYEC